MKTTSLLVTLSVITCISLAGCDNMTISNSNNSTAKVNGNGVVKTQERPVTSFNKIEVEGVFNVFLSQSEIESVKVETDENIQPLIVTSVDNNVLSVKMRDSTTIGKLKKINIYIGVVNLKEIKTTGVGKLECSTKINVTDLDLNCSGVGITKLNVWGDKLNINSEIVGALMLEGDVKEATIKHSGLGIIQAFDLKTEKLSLNSEGIGAAEVFASKDLTITANGLGGVKYKGNPAIKRIKKEGLGKVEEAD